MYTRFDRWFCTVTASLSQLRKGGFKRRNCRKCDHDSRKHDLLKVKAYKLIIVVFYYKIMLFILFQGFIFNYNLQHVSDLCDSSFIYNPRQPLELMDLDLHTLLHFWLWFIFKRRGFSCRRRSCRRRLHQRDLLLHRWGGKRRGGAGGGRRVLDGWGGGRRCAAEAAGNLVESFAPRLWDFDEGEDEEEDEEGHEDEEDPRPAQLLRRRERGVRAL